MNQQLLLSLLSGAFVCDVSHPDAFSALAEQSARDDTDAWLGAIGLRLARTSSGSAYFVAPQILSAQHVAMVREDMRRFRDVYGPSVQMLNLIRQAKDGFEASPGEYVQLAELESGVNESPTLEAQLRSMHGDVLTKVSAKHSNREFLKKLLEGLKSAGFLVLSSSTTDTYQVTGKIDHLHAVLEFISENNSEVISDGEEPTDGDETGALDLRRDLDQTQPGASDA